MFRNVLGSGTIQLLVLERREPTANVARFYVLSVEETLFGDTALVREWGRLGTRGHRRLDLYPARAQAREALASWLIRKLHQGHRAQLPFPPPANVPSLRDSDVSAC